MTVKLQEATLDDIPACGKVMYEAFRSIAQQHNFPPDFPSSEETGGLLSQMLGAPGFDAFTARIDNNIVGSIFVSRRSPVGGISVITVDPAAQNRAIGRALMEHGMNFLTEHGHERQQLIQAAYHNRSLCLYAKLGFKASDMLSMMAGDGVKAGIAGRRVRTATADDIADCNVLCHQVHGFDRAGEVMCAVEQQQALVVECDGRITGYTTGVGFAGHGVGESNEDLKAMIASVEQFAGPSILVPTTNSELFRWCLDNGLRVVQQMTLMDTSSSGRLSGAYWPSILC
jgi:GNAT superfamily N-acetyltransferase